MASDISHLVLLVKNIAGEANQNTASERKYEKTPKLGDTICYRSIEDPFGHVKYKVVFRKMPLFEGYGGVPLVGLFPEGREL